jgi:transposase
MESKSVKKSRRKYDAEFKKEVIRMIEMGRSVPEVGQSLGIGSNLIYQWIRRYKKGDGNTEDYSEVAYDDQKASLHKRIKELEIERDILKKALGIFSR